jgi:hypothetical protein
MIKLYFNLINNIYRRSEVSNKTWWYLIIHCILDTSDVVNGHVVDTACWTIGSWNAIGIYRKETYPKLQLIDQDVEKVLFYAWRIFEKSDDDYYVIVL